MGLIRLSVHEIHLGLNVLKVVLKALELVEGEGPITFVDLRLEGLPQTKLGPQKLNT